MVSELRGRADDPHPSHRRTLRQRTGQSAGLPSGWRGHDHRCHQGRVADEPGLVPQPEGPPPRITVEVGTATFPVEAREVTGDERNELWRRLVAMRPGFAEYETKTSRTFPMFRLTRLSCPTYPADG